MRASTVLFTLFASLAAAVPSQQVPGGLAALEARQCSPTNTCSRGNDDGTSCSLLVCCSGSKSGAGGGSCCCN
ncbi:hypothetical protein LX36DRAFT_714957 [Colletotrichum falcatum]|nr:hypothetical protein LX36DRAFT_714957 [Colletotrichum falcatum]